MMPPVDTVGVALAPRPHSNRRGIALATVIFALTVIGALVAASLVIAMQESRVGDNARYSVRAFNAAEAGIAQQVESWKANRYDTLSVGDSTVVAATSIAGGSYSGVVTRLSPQLFLVLMTGTERAASASQAQARIGRIVRVTSAGINVNGAVTTQGPVKVTGGTAVNGNDAAPNSNWSGCPPLANLAGIRTPNASQVTLNGAGQIAGSPQIQNDTTVNNSSFENFGGSTYQSLASAADITLPSATYTGIGPAVTGGVCNTSNTNNWGDGSNPSAPCGSYFPIVHITGTGTTTLNSSEGQGVLLVDGNLKLASGTTFYGIIVVLGTIDIGGGASVYGGVLAQDSTGSGDTFAGTSAVHYSSCAVQAALKGTAVARPLKARSWFTG